MKDEKVTTLVNLFGGPGVGKSTLAAGVVHELKIRGHEAVLVHEECKANALANYQADPFDRLEVFARQCANEKRFYGLVEFIVTDSPLELNAFYNDQEIEGGRGWPFEAIVENLRTQGPTIFRLDFLVTRTVTYDTAGRYETEREALLLDGKLDDFLATLGIIPIKIGLCPGIMADLILGEFSLDES